MATSRINGVELYYEIRGTGDWLMLTHGSWTDGAGWGPAVELLAERYRVLVWDRRGHSRSQSGDGAGSRAEDAADLAGLIEHVADEPVHVAGNSYGANVTLTLVSERPDVVATAAAHEPPLFSLLNGARDQTLADELSVLDADLDAVRAMIGAGGHRHAAQYFIDHVALGAGTWDQLPEAFRSALAANAPTYLDELADQTAQSLDTAALATTTVPLLLTRGTDSPPLFGAVVTELARRVPAARVEILAGAGHIPHATHPQDWTARLSAFHDLQRSRPIDAGR